MRARHALLFAFIPLTLFPATPAAGAGSADASVALASPVMLVVDTSGSMGDSDPSGRVKIEGAKASLLDFLKSVEPGTPLGLRTYPGPSAGCDVGTLQFAVEPRDPGPMAATIRTLEADGDTPTPQALGAAAQDLKDAGYRRGTLILVSDGESTCGDPCPEAKRIEQSGIALQAITVGFQISPEGEKELRCIANAMNGEYINADKSKTLQQQLAEAAHPTLHLELQYPPETIAEVGSANGFVTVKATISNTGGQPARAVLTRLRFDAGAPGVVGPVRELGNLAPNESRVVEWRFRPSVLLIGKSVRFTVLARSDNGLTDAEASGEVRVKDAATAADAGPILRLPGRLAILGDSYSSGEGARDYFSGTDSADNHCHRSPHTYLFEAFQLPESSLIACSGAIGQDFYLPNETNHVQSQASQLVQRMEATNDMVSGVVFTIGGNDAQFRAVVESCLESLTPDSSSNCDKKISHLDGREPVSSNQFVKDLPGTLADLSDDYIGVNSVLNSSEAIRARGRAAPILVLAYPLPIPTAKRSCLNLTTVSEDEIKFIVRFETRLNGVIEGEVRQARDEGVPVFFIPNTEDAFQPDHTVCDNVSYENGPTALPTLPAKPDWTASFKIALAGLIAGPLGEGYEGYQQFMDEFNRSIQQLFHPNAAGYKAETRAVIRWSRSNEATDAMAFLNTTKPAASPPLPTWPVSNVELGPSSNASEWLQAGTGYPLQADGFLPGSDVTITMHSRTVVIGTGHADSNGHVKTLIGIPHGLADGKHEIDVVGLDPRGRDRVVRIRVKVLGRGMAAPAKAVLFGAGGTWMLALVAWLGSLVQRRRREADEG